MQPDHESAIDLDPRSGRVFDHDRDDGGYAVFPARYATRLVLEAADLRAMVEFVLARCRPIKEEGGDTTISYAADLSTTERAAMERIVRGGPIDVKRYRIIYADPPWDYGGRAVWDRGAASDHYSTQNVEWIASLPVESICAWDAAIFLWATTVKLREALYVMRAWGFEYKNVGFTWVKTYPQNGEPFFGVGQWTRGNAELCLFGTRGSVERKDKGVPQVIMAPVLGHSRKPDEARVRIERLLGDVPRIELFAREASPMFPKPPGWHWWGDEVDSDVDLGPAPVEMIPGSDHVVGDHVASSAPLPGQLDFFDVP